MSSKYNDKNKVIEYLSVIRDAEIAKHDHEADKELINACVELLLDLQNKDAHLTPEQIDELVNKIPFIETKQIINLKTNKKKINKIKLLLIAAIIPILLTILTLIAMADIDWSYAKVLKESFGGVDKTPVGEVIYDNGVEIEKNNAYFYESPEDFAKDYDIHILIPGYNFTQNSISSITLVNYPTGNEIEIYFEKGGLNYIIYTYDVLQKETQNLQYIQKNINGFDCYIVDLSDVGLYQVYLNHNGYTYCFNHSELNEIINLIENLEEIE